MTDLNSTPSVQEDSRIPPEKQSPWVMLVSMVLLICSLLLASAMLFHYGQQKHGDASGPGFNFAQVTEKARALMADKPDSTDAATPPNSEPAAQKEGEPSSLSIKKLFSSSGDGVKWPKLKLEGFGKSADGEGGFAIINGKQVLVGGYIDKVKIVEVQTHGVMVELENEQRILSIELTK